MQHRHIGLQIKNLAKLLAEQAALGWYEVEILSVAHDQDNKGKPNAHFAVKLSRLDGSGQAKYFQILRNGKIIPLGVH